VPFVSPGTKSSKPAATAHEHQTIVPRASYSPWNLDASFAKVYRQCQPQTLVDVYRCYEIWSLVSEAAELPEGDLLKELILGAIRKSGYEIFKTPAATAHEHQTIVPRAS
jgi:hypothetical protein